MASSPVELPQGRSPPRESGTIAQAAMVMALVLLAATAAGQQPATASRQIANLPISLDADSSDFDYKNNLLVFRRVTISQGGMKVEAEQANATGLNFENSRWIFRGKVRITVPDGVLTSDDATVTFAGNELARALIYKMSDQRVVADADEQGKQPVRITINPRGGSTPPAPRATDRPTDKP